MNAKQLRQIIGSRVEWVDAWDPARGGFIRTGILEAVEGRNVMIDGEWKWRTNLRDLKQAAESARPDAPENKGAQDG